MIENRQNALKDTCDEKIRRDSEYLSILTSAMDFGVSILDEDLNYLYISDAVYHVLEVTPDELSIGDPLSRCHELMIEKGLLTPELIEQQKLSESRQREQNRNQGPDGSRLMTFGNGTTHRLIRKSLPNGLTVSISSDVSELVEKDQLLDKALTLGRSTYWSLDLATKAYTLSKTLEHFIGRKLVRKIHQEGVLCTIHPDDRGTFKKALGEAGKTNDLFDVKLRGTPDLKKGHDVWFRVRGALVRDQDGKATSISAFTTDISEERRQAAELEKAKDEAIAASKAKSEFLANMSHEIRTPMNGILGMAELLANSDVNERQRDFVSVINNSASALLTIINDILDFSKIEAGAFEIDPVPFDLKSSINDVAALMNTNAHEKGLELIINYPADLPRGFIGDAGRLRQVITNLVGNAVKFTESGHITIDVDIQQSQNTSICTVQVTDTGIGISPEKMNRIFDKFTQADGSTTRVYGGTGLGLTISKHIIEMMGGRMKVSSKLGEGSTFGFRVPLPIDRNAKLEAFDSSLIAGKRILIVDDIEINRNIFSEQLKAWDVETEIAIDGVDALTKVRLSQDIGRPYDLILLDFLMPGMDGRDFAQMLTQTSTLDRPQMIMLSSCDQPVSSAELAEIGIGNYLIKPVRERRLFDTIVRALSNPIEIISPKQSQSLTSKKTPRTKESKLVPTAPLKQEVLVAEDFALNQDVVKLMLADTPFEPIFVENGQEAVDLYMMNPERFPLIVMDVSMPVMDGFDATRLIRSFELENELKPIPIIALTGHALKNDRLDCINAGMDDYLTKPVKQMNLIEKLELYSGKVAAIEKSA